MKRVLVVLAAMAAVLLPYGTAHAYPIKDKTLTENALYSAGELDTTECTEKRVRPRNVKLVRAYLHGLLDCLNTTWSAQLEKSGQTFRKPRLQLTTKNVRRFCSEKLSKDTHSYYCEKNRTILIVLTKNFLSDPGDLFLFGLLGELYGEHVQNLTDIYGAYVDHAYRNKKELREQGRRIQLQSVCFSAAFLKSTWESLDRTPSDWRTLLRHFKSWDSPWTGNRTNLGHWASRGYSTGDPGSCNTWTASSKRVA